MRKITKKEAQKVIRMGRKEAGWFIQQWSNDLSAWYEIGPMDYTRACAAVRIARQILMTVGKRRSFL